MANENVDERVVQLRLDNKDFDQNAKKSTKTLDDLKKALEFEGVAKGFEDITRASRKVDMSILENGLVQVQNHFNFLNTIATTALTNITNRAMNAGETLLKAFTIDNISAGWSKFEQKTTGVASLISQGYSMDVVDKQLERLNWFTDETSYNFTAMANSIGKFTASGQDLENSTTALMGIANWAALSGQNATTASHAMYQLSQAMGAGVMRKEDYRSIQNVSMDTAEFRQKALDAGVALGTLKKVGNDTYQSLMANTDAFTRSQFSEHLTEDAWFTSDVMMKVYQDYANAVDRIREYALENNVTAAEAIEDLGDELDTFGIKAFNAAGEARSWADVIDSVKDAVSTGWMKSFEYIFGNYEEAKELFTTMADELWDIFTAGVNEQNAVLKGWKELGGRNVMLEAFGQLWQNVKDILDIVSKAWDRIFGVDTEDKIQNLLNLTARFKDFAGSLSLSNEAYFDLINLLSSLFSVFKSIGQVVSTVIRALSPLIAIFNKLAGAVVSLITDFAQMLSMNIDAIFNEEALQKVYNVLHLISIVVTYLASGAIDTVANAIKGILGIVSDLAAVLRGERGGIDGFIDRTIAKLQTLWESLSSGQTIFSKILAGIVGAAAIVGGAIGTVVSSVVGFFTGDKMKPVTDTISNITESGKMIDDSKIEEKLGVVGTALIMVRDSIHSITHDIFEEQSELRITFDKVKGLFIDFWNWMNTSFGGINPMTISQIGMVVAMTMFLLELKKLSAACTGVVGTVNGIFKTFATFSKQTLLDDKTFFLDQLSKILDKTKIIQIGVAAVLLVAALSEFNKLDTQRTMQSILMIGLMSAVLVATVKQLNKAMTSASESLPDDGDDKKNDFAMQFLKVSASIFVIAQALASMNEAIGKNGINTTLQSVAILGSALAVLFAAVRGMSKLDTDSVKDAATAMIQISVAIMLLAIPIKTLGSMDLAGMVWGTLAVIGLIGTLGGVMKMLSTSLQKIQPSTMASIAVAFLGMAGSIGILTMAIGSLTALIALGGWNAAGAFVGVVGMISALGLAIGLLGTYLKKTPPTTLLSMSVAMIAFAAAIDILAAAVAVLSLIPFAIVAGNIILFTSAISIILAVANGCAAATGPLLALAAVIVSFGASVALFAVGIKTLAEALVIFSTTVIALGVLANQIGEEFPAIIDKGLQTVEQIISGFLMMIIKLTPQLSMAAAALIGAFISGLLSCIPGIMTAFATIGLAILNVIASFAEPIMSALVKLVQGLNAHLPELFEALGEFIFNIFQGIGYLIHDAISGIGYLVRAAFTGEMTSYETYKAMKGGAQTAMDYATQGIKVGSKEFVDALEEVGGEGSQKMLDTFNETQGASSPADEFIKALLYSAMGVEKGGEDHLIPTSENVGVAGGNALANNYTVSAMNGIMDGMDDVNNLIASYDLGEGGLFNIGNHKRSWWGYASVKDSSGPGDYSRYDKQGATGAIEVYKPTEEDEEDYTDSMFDLGEAGGEALGKGTKAGATKEKEKTAEEIVKENLDAISNAYSRGIKALDLREQRKELDDKFWEATHKDPGDNATEAEKEAYEVAKRQHDLEVIDRKMQNQQSKMVLSQIKYEETLNEMGASATETAEAYNAMLEDRLELINLYNERNDMLTKTNEVNTDEFIKASREITNYNDLVKEGFFTQEEVLMAAKSKMDKYNVTATETIEDTNEAINKLSSEIEELLSKGTNIASTEWRNLFSETFLDAISNVESVDGDLKWSMTNLVANAAEEISKDPLINYSAQGIGAAINEGTVSGMDAKKKLVLDKGAEVSQDTLDTMANTLEVNSPSKATTRMGEWLDEGLVQGLLNDGKVQAIMNAADSIARKLIARLKAKLGVHSPSTISDEIGGYFDDGLVNGVYRKVYAVRDAGNYLAESLSNATRSSLDQNGNLPNGYMKDLFGLTDDDLHLQVVVDIDNSRAIDSMSQLEAYTSGALSGTISTSADRRYIRQDRSSDAVFQARALTDAYSALNETLEYIRQSKEPATPKADTPSEPTNVTFNQYNTSPKPISTLDTYRNTKKQLSTFERKFSKK